MRKGSKRSSPGYASYLRQLTIPICLTLPLVLQNKEAEAKEELKRRAKQLEMQRREQQRRAAAGGPSGGSYLGGGISGYAPVAQREYNAPTPIRTASPAPSSLRAPAFKGSGMKLGAKKTQQSALLEALHRDAALRGHIGSRNARYRK